MRSLLSVCLGLVIALAGRAAAPPAVGVKYPGVDPDEPLPPGAIARLGTSRLRTTASAVVFAPGGRTLLTIADGRNLARWNAGTGRLHEETHLPGPVTDRSWFSADGRTLAVPEEGGLGLWDTGTGKRRWLLKVSAHTAAFAPDGRTLATVEYARKGDAIRLWNLSTGQGRLFARLPEHVRALAFGTDGKRLIATMYGHCLCWETASDRLLWRNDHSASRLAVSPDGKTLVTSAYVNGPVRLWDARTGREIATLKSRNHWTGSLTFAPDGRSVAQGTYEGVFLWDVRSHELLHHFKEAGPRIAFAADGRTLVSLGGLLQRWDTRTGKPLYPDTRARGHVGPVTAVVFAPDGRSVVTAGEDRTVRLWNLATGWYRVLRTDADSGRRVGISKELGGVIPVPGVPPAFTPDGRFLLTASTVGNLALTEVATGKEARRFRLPVRPRTWAWVGAARLTADGNTVLALAESVSLGSNLEFNEPLRGWNLMTGQEVLAKQVPRWESAFSVDGKFLLLGGEPGNLQDVRSGEKLPLRRGAKSVGPPFAFSADGRLLAAAAPGFLDSDSRPTKSLHVYEILTGQLVARMKAPLGYCQAVAFSPDGRLLAAAGSDALHAWASTTGRRLLHLPARGRLTGWTPAGFARCLAFAPNGKVLATGHADGTVLLWDVTDARRKLAARPPRPIVPKTCWASLASANGRKAYAAIDRLVDQPAQAQALLRREMRPVKVDPRWLAARLADLDSDSFATRESAMAALQRIAGVVGGELRRQLARSSSLEARSRLRRLLALRQPLVPPPEQLRQLRAVAVLERLGSAEAVALLRELARGEAEARLTREAAAALGRLGR